MLANKIPSFLTFLALSLIPGLNLSHPAYAADDTEVESPLTMPDGVYTGRGVLTGEWWMPKVKFDSVRIFSHGTLTSRAVGHILGLNKVIEAKLKFTSLGKGSKRFLVSDITTPGSAEYGKVVGDGWCDGNRCSHSAIVMKGKLILQETWIINSSGFDVVDAWQVMDGMLLQNYDAHFDRQ